MPCENSLSLLESECPLYISFVCIICNMLPSKNLHSFSHPIQLFTFLLCHAGQKKPARNIIRLIISVAQLHFLSCGRGLLRVFLGSWSPDRYSVACMICIILHTYITIIQLKKIHHSLTYYDYDYYYNSFFPSIYFFEYVFLFFIFFLHVPPIIIILLL